MNYLFENIFLPLKKNYSQVVRGSSGYLLIAKYPGSKQHKKQEAMIQLSPNLVLQRTNSHFLFALFDPTAGKQQVEIRLYFGDRSQSSSRPES